MVELHTHKQSETLVIVHTETTKKSSAISFYQLPDSEDMSFGHGAFAARKVREQMDNAKEFETNADDQKFNYQINNDLSAPNYNGKLMNSIWGLYNRYAVHNLKKNSEIGHKGVMSSMWGVSGNGTFDEVNHL